MGRKLKAAPNRRTAGERGHVLILVLILLVLGSLMIGPLLSFTAGGLKTGLVYEKKTDELYAADAGMQDATWRIKYDHLEALLPGYSAFDFSAGWEYALPNQVNSKDTRVRIENVWIPQNVSAPDEEEGGAIIGSEKLLVAGSASGNSYTIKITFSPQPGEHLRVETLGIWLPRGFSYVAGSSNLEASPSAEYYSVPVTSPHAGNQAVLWTFDSILFTSLPGVNPAGSPQTSEITFQFAPALPGSKPTAVAWITTSEVADIPFSWDADNRVFKIISQAGGTKVGAYVAKEEIRRMRSSIAGDYHALGNSLMIDTNHDSHGIRDQLLTSSDSTVSSIPADADVAAAFLYWSAWRSDSAKQTVFSDSCSNLNNWNYGSSWSTSSGSFRSHYNSGGEPARYLTLKDSVDLTPYAPGTVIVSWDQSESGSLEPDDGLDFALSADGGFNWSSNIQAFRDNIGGSPTRYTYVIPAQYLTINFKIRFYLNSFSNSDDGYAYIDNIAVQVMPPDTSVVFEIDGQQVYLDTDGTPKKGALPLTASRFQVLPNASGINGFSYAAYRDVTQLVRTFSAKAPDPAINHPGNGTYAVGDVAGNTGTELSYAGWSLIIIYASESTLGHQLYLFDKFIYASGDTNIDFDNDGQPGGHISGFVVPNQIAGELNAAKLTVFVGEGDQCYSGDSLRFNDVALSNAQSPADNVWNGRSPGLTADGVDIDTFDITWASGLLQPGDTSAQIDIPTEVDNWNIIYMVLSFRSESTTGGALSYLIW